MAGTRPENPETEADKVQFPETVPDPVDDGCDPQTGYEPGTELVPEKGDFHTPQRS